MRSIIRAGRIRGSICLTAAFLLAVMTGCADEPEAIPSGDLFEAAAAGDVTRVRSLLDRGASPDERDGSGRTAVTAAVYAGSAETVRLLVAAGADVDAQDDMRSNAFLALGETGDVAVLDEVLRADPDVGRTNRFGGTALIPAADRGHVEMVRALLDRTTIDVDHVNDLGWTALLEAVILSDGGPAHQEIVRLLVAAGADPSIGDSAGMTPRRHAQAMGFTEIVSILDGLPTIPAG